MNKKALLISLLLLGTMKAVESPFNLTYVFPEDMHGWLGISNRARLKEFITAKNPKKVVEIGTWMGVSAIFAAKLLESDAKLYCIDPWVPYHDMVNMPDCQERLKNAYERFLSNCIHHKVTEKIIPLRMTSMAAVQLEEFSSPDIDLIYIDGSHSENDVFDDIMHWYHKVAPQGIMCGDDIEWPSVHRALLRAAPLLNVTIQQDGNFWWFEKK